MNYIHLNILQQQISHKPLRDFHAVELLSCKRLVRVETTTMQISRSRISGMAAARLISRRIISASRDQRVLFSSQLDFDEDDRVTDDKFRSANQITLKSKSGNMNYPPMTDFNMTPFSDNLKRVLKAEGFAGPTPTQAQSWPIALDERDIISVARTGSGKTCGFLLPAFHKLSVEKAAGKVQPSQTSDNPYARAPIRTPTVLVLAPTRELTVQIDAEAQKFARGTGFTSVW